MKSIRRQMTVYVSLAVLFLVGIGGSSLYFALRNVLVRKFDDLLRTKSQALISASEVDDDEYEIDLIVQEFAGFGSRTPGDYFEVRDAKGKTLLRSPSLYPDHLPVRSSSTHSGTIESITLPDGRAARAIWQVFTPSDDDYRQYPDLEIVVASESGELFATIASIRNVLLVFAGIGILIALAAMNFSLRRGLYPLNGLALDVQEIDSESLNRRIAVSNLTIELAPVGEKINELLERLEKSFARERRFSSSAAHEMRTPLAELKVMAEMAHRWPDDFSEDQGREILASVETLAALVEKLSLLCRTEGEVALERKPLPLRTMVEGALERVNGTVTERKLTIECDVAKGEVYWDPTLFHAVLTNLIGNAADHSPPGTTIRIAGDTSRFQVSNQAPELATTDLPFLFERFWRKRGNEVDESHSGLGLSIVKAAVDVMGASCEARLDDGELSIEIDWKNQAR